MNWGSIPRRPSDQSDLEMRKSGPPDNHRSTAMVFDDEAVTLTRSWHLGSEDLDEKSEVRRVTEDERRRDKIREEKE